MSRKKREVAVEVPVHIDNGSGLSVGDKVIVNGTYSAFNKRTGVIKEVSENSDDACLYGVVLDVIDWPSPIWFHHSELDKVTVELAEPY